MTAPIVVNILPSIRNGSQNAKHNSDSFTINCGKFPLVVNISIPIRNMITERKTIENPVMKMYLIQRFIF